MKYETIYQTLHDSRILIIRQLFEEHKIKFRILNEATNNAIPVGKRVQVPADQIGRAKDVLKQHGFLGTPRPEPGTGENKRYWLFLVLALLLVILFSILINSL